MFKSANVTVMVVDMNRAFDFYTHVLGFHPGARHGDYYGEVKAPGVTIVLHPRRQDDGEPAASRNLSIGLHVDRLEEAVERLRKAHVSFRRLENDANRFAL